jgi:hypothetical protein
MTILIDNYINCDLFSVMMACKTLPFIKVNYPSISSSLKMIINIMDEYDSIELLILLTSLSISYIVKIILLLFIHLLTHLYISMDNLLVYY